MAGNQGYGAATDKANMPAKICVGNPTTGPIKSPDSLNDRL
jgi:hypothetical protein